MGKYKDTFSAKADVPNGSQEFESLKGTDRVINDNDKHPRIVSGLNQPLPVKPLGEQTRAVRRQGLMVILGNLGVVATGMGLGLPSVTLRKLTDPNELVHLTESQGSWFASLNMVTSPLGGILGSYILDKYGRKNTLYVLNILSLIAWILMALAMQEDSEIVYIQLLISRFIIGIASGLSSAPVGVYSAEISLPKIRGRLILGTSISVAAGITLIYILGYIIRDDWRLIALICVFYSIVSLLCVIPMPETPSWLLSKGRVEEAKQSLNYFRGLEKKTTILHPEVLAEFNLLQKSIQFGVKKDSLLKTIRLPEVYKPLFILIGLFTFQQLTGIFVVIVYAVQISTDAGVQIDPFMCAVFIGVARVVTTIPMGVILERWGRRRAAIISGLGMGTCMLLLAGCCWSEWLRTIPYLPVIAIVLFIVLSTIGIYTLPFFMVSELFPQKVRGSASGVTVAVGLFVAFICIKTYPSMRHAFGNEFVFFFYGMMAFVAVVFVYFVLPETRGRTLLEIEEEFRSGRRKNRGKALRKAQAQKGFEVEMQEVFVK